MNFTDPTPADVAAYIDAEQARAELRHNSDRRDDERDPDDEYDFARELDAREREEAE